MIDRFHNGDISNSLGDNAECSDESKSNWLRYWGGDIQGIMDKKDYLKALGVTSLWITPIFEQMDAVTNDEGKLSAPYHGYWTRDFKRIDEHFLPKSDWHKPFSDWNTLFDQFIETFHCAQIKIFLDVSCNHTHQGAEGIPKGDLYDDGKWLTSFENDVLGWYNRFGPIKDWNNPIELTKGELRGLADLNEEVWSLRFYLYQTMQRWLDRGVDGFRLDAVKHMSLSFWQEFTAIMRKNHPNSFFFGEWAGIGPWDKRGIHFTNHSGMSVLDFSFQSAIQDVFCRGQSFQRIAKVFYDDDVYDDATELVTFIDNHDMPRLLSVGLALEHLSLALVLLMTARGIPCLFYGTEQALHNDTMGGGDPYNRPMMTSFHLESPWFKIISILAELRREHKGIQRGFTRDVHVSQDVYVFARSYERSTALIVINRGKQVDLHLNSVLLPDGIYFDLLDPKTFIVVEEEGIESLHVPQNKAFVFANTEEVVFKESVLVRFNGYRSFLGERVILMGDCPELGEWNPEKSIQLNYVNANCWMVDVEFNESLGKEILYRFAVIRADKSIQYEDCLPRKRRVDLERDCYWKERWMG